MAKWRIVSGMAESCTFEKKTLSLCKYILESKKQVGGIFVQTLIREAPVSVFFGIRNDFFGRVLLGIPKEIKSPIRGSEEE